MNPTGGGPGLTLDPPILAANPARGSPPSADRRLPKGATLRVRRRSTLDGARRRGSSTMIRGSRLKPGRLRPTIQREDRATGSCPRDELRMEMSLRIQSDAESIAAQRNLGLAAGTVTRATERLSSGYRINRASDDASGLTISERLRGQIRGLAQNQRNIQDGISLTQTAEAALAGVHGMLQRVRELAVQYKNGTYSATNTQAMQSEVNQLASEIERLGRSASFNGIQLLSNAGTINLQVGANDGASESIGMATISLAQQIGTAYAQLGAATDLAEVDAALDAVSVQRSAMGAAQNRLESALDNVRSAQVNMIASESRIRDVDMADEVLAMARGQILSQSGTAMLAQANQASQASFHFFP